MTTEWKQKAREFVYGMTGYEFEQHALELRGALETVFMAITFGDMLGLPPIGRIQGNAARGRTWFYAAS